MKADVAANRSRLGRAAWSGIDQVISSLTNFVLGIVVARSVSAEQFGAFSIGFLMYGMAVGLNAALVGEPLMIRGTGPDHADRGRANAAAGTALGLGCLIGVALLAVSRIAVGPISSTFMAFGLCMPGLLLQDTLRHRFFQTGRPASAAGNDLLWAVLQVAGLSLAAAARPGSLAWLVVSWGGAATVAAAVGCAQARVVPLLRRVPSFVRFDLRLRLNLAGDFVLMNAAGQASVYATTLIVGLAAAGSLQGAQVLFGPVMIAISGAKVFALAEGARMPDRQALVLRARQLAMVLAALGVAWTTAAAALPDSLGRELMGDSWQGVSRLLVLVGISTVARAAAAPAGFGLRIVGDGARIIQARRIDAPITVLLGVGGAALGGAAGAAAGAGMANVIATVVWWRAFRSAAAATAGAEFRPDPGGAPTATKATSSSSDHPALPWRVE